MSNSGKSFDSLTSKVDSVSPKISDLENDPGRRPGLVVKGGDSFQRVVSSNPGTRYLMEIFHINLL